MSQKTNRTKKYAALCAILLSMAIMTGCASSSIDGGNSTDSVTSSPAAENAVNGDTQAQQTDTATLRDKQIGGRIFYGGKGCIMILWKRRHGDEKDSGIISDFF